ncbi:MAG: hypothetical protein A3G87_04970 [Omnitrophica bacterium RIFCSPLOWO2_12_FULL_50_11]|nr:MAG: hypothetical protein A3G87_04970 [Omnitrophica bacterium RIFCSPLOWO2_12_FULL_50_11]
MRLVLDSNEYLFAFGFAKKPASIVLMDLIVTRQALLTIRIPRLIIEEIRRNLPGDIFREVIAFIQRLTHIDEDFLIPFELGSKYELAGLKSADALIAAYAKWVRADWPVTENRHFLSRHKTLPFRVLTAEQCVKFIRSS